MNSAILLHGVHLHVHLGVPPEERAEAQAVLVDIALSFDTAPAGRSDRFADTIDYAAVRDTLAAAAARRPYALVESLAESIAEAILAAFPVDQVRVLVKKPRALAHAGVEWAGVEIVRRRGG